MSDLDKAIREALSAEDAALLERLGAEPALPQRLLETFGGPFAFINVMGWVAGLAIFAVGVYCGWRFWTAPDLREMLVWMGAGGLATAGVVMIKLWFWMELQRQATVREIKRLELQIARLAASHAV
ncbi:MAG: hypothetical protein JNJ73_21710 [Hyphomonadaceae bacterium]|nr:hypothetical protein [Hyphomonadaceae bacterium]